MLFRSTRHDPKKAVVEDAPVVANGDFLADEEAAGDIEATSCPSEQSKRSSLVSSHPFRWDIVLAVAILTSTGILSLPSGIFPQSYEQF